MKLAACGILFPCLASIVQSFAPLWVFMALIITGMCFTAVGLLLAQRKAKRTELEWRMEKAFGKPTEQSGTSASPKAAGGSSGHSATPAPGSQSTSAPTKSA